MTKKKLGSLAALALIAAACADPAGPAMRDLQPTAPSHAIIPDDDATYGFPSSNGIFAPELGNGDGWVRLCKVSNVPGTFDFDYSVNGNPVGGSPDVQITVSAGQVNTRVCHPTPLHNSDLAANLIDEVVVVEANPGANTTVVVDIEQHYVSTITDYHANYLADEWNVAPRTAKVFINDDLEKVIIFNNTTRDTPPPALYGCTPGYWKQSHHFGNWVGYTQNQSYYTVFGVAPEGGLPNTLTLLGALQMGGGGIKAMVRHSVASLLNAAKGFAPYSTDDIIGFVQSAFATNNYSLAHNLFEDYNETGCPLGRAP